MIKTKTTTDMPTTESRATIERLRPQFYLGRQITLVVDLVE